VRRRTLRVGVPPDLLHLPPHSSVARIWQAALPLLGRTCRIRAVDPAAPRKPRLDVWLTDGHQGPLPVAEPVVAHFHEAAWDHPDLARHLDPDFVARYAPASAAAARGATRLLTVSESSRRQLVAAYDVDPARVLVAHNGVDLDLHRPGLLGAADVVAGAGGDPSRPYVLFVGTLHPRKNLAVLRQAMADLAAAGHPHGLVLVAGPAPDRTDSAALAAAATLPIAGRAVVNVAPVGDEDLARVLSGASALCLPSLMEGFGLPVLEAMACGTPVVVSDRGALPEVVGDAGVVVEPTAAGVARGLRSVLEDPHRAAVLRRRGRERAQRFSWDAMVEVWQVALRQAADPAA
jgi:glycosyltransferase involved in cell wall biosynthesis